MNLQSTRKRNTQLFDLYWEDIIVSNVLPYLSLNDCFNFRCASKTCLQIINIYFAGLKSLKLMNKGFSPHTFKVFTSTCTKLTVLNLSRCMTITDFELIPLLLQNRGLVSLNLSQCCNLSAKCLQPVILYCNNLQALKLSRCAWLTTGAMEALALHQHSLEDVDLSHCPLISESCILIFIKKFRNLKTFNLEGNRQVSDKLLFTLGKFSKELKLLNLVGCCDITDKGIKALGQHCKSLEGLLVRGCPSVTEGSLRPLRRTLHLDRRAPEIIPTEIERLDQELQDRNQWARANIVEIRGIPLKKNENLYKIIQKLGNLEKGGNKPHCTYTSVPSGEKAIVVAFNSHYLKEEFIASSPKIKQLNLSNLGE